MESKIIGICLILYGLGLLLFVRNSLQEFSRKFSVTTLAAMGNMILCLLWPLTLMGFALIVWVRK